MIGIIVSITLTIFFYYMNCYTENKNNNKKIDKIKTIGIIESIINNSVGDIEYIIKINENMKVKSARYTKKVNEKLQKGDKVEIEYYINKKGKYIADIITPNLVPRTDNLHNIFFHITTLCIIISIFLTVNLIYPHHIHGMNKYVIVSGIVTTVILLIIITFKATIILKKGKIVKAKVIKKEFYRDTGADSGTSNKMKYDFIITVEYENKVLKEAIGYNTEAKEINVGDEIEIIVYKNHFILNDEEYNKKTNK